MDYFIGTILPWAASWAPQGWMLCNGALLPVADNQVLYSIIGTTYGGTPGINFNLPDLRGRMPIGSGVASGLTSNRVLGQKGGSEIVSLAANASGSVTITTNNLPPHTHAAALSLTGLSSSAQTSMTVSTGANGAINAPANCQLSTSPSSGGLSAGIFIDAATTPTTPSTLKGFTTTVTTTGSGTVTLANTGAGAPLPINATVNANIAAVSPFSCINFIICISGIYPVRP